MILYYIRHGDPIYSPNSLTPLGHRQAEAVAKRLAVYGLDKIYASTSNRAVLTAQPTCELLKMQAELLDFADERYAWEQLTVKKEDGGRMWMFYHPETVEVLHSAEVRALEDRWYDHPALKDYGFDAGIARVYDEADAFFASLGYEHNRYTGQYTVKRSNDQRIALFAHQGFGLVFLSCLLDIPFPQFSRHFDMCHSGMTVIEFEEKNGLTTPKILTLSSDSHLYREGLPTHYNHHVYI